MIPYMTKGIKYTLAGDNKGNIHVWLSNGTFKGSVKIGSNPIIKL